MINNLDQFTISLEDIIKNSKNIYIIGHKNPDFDSIGSSIGVFKLCKFLGKKSTIIVNEDEFSLQPGVKLLMDAVDNCITFINIDQYKERLIKGLNKTERNTYDETPDIEKEKYLFDKKVKDSTLIITDTNNIDLLSIKNYLNNFENIIIIDHHKKITNPELPSTLSFINQNYSSASEIVTTILHKYTKKYPPKIATALASGIVLDTDNFKRNTTENTYKVYTTLKKNGVTDDNIRKIFRKDFETDKLVKNLVFNNGNAIEFFNLISNNNVSIILNREAPETIYKNEMIGMAADERQEYDDVDATIVMGKILDADENKVIKISVRTNGYIDGGRLLSEYCSDDEYSNGGGSVTSAAALIQRDSLLEEEKNLINFIKQTPSDHFVKKLKKI